MVFITKILLVFYALGILGMMLRLLSLQSIGSMPTFKDIGNILLFPLYLLTKAGCNRLAFSLKIKEKDKL